MRLKVILLKERMIAEEEKELLKILIIMNQCFLPESSLPQASQLLDSTTNSFSSSATANLTSSSVGRKSKRRTEMEASRLELRNIADVIGGNAGQLGEAEILEDLFLISGENYGSGNGNSSGLHSGSVEVVVQEVEMVQVMESEKPNPISQEKHTITLCISKNKMVLFPTMESPIKGDDVILEKDDQDDILGEIISISNSEIWIKAAEGVRVKVSISQLRLGKAFVSHVGTR